MELNLSVRMKLKAALKWCAMVVGVAAMICPMLPFVLTQCFRRSFILVDDEIVWATIYQITVYVFWLVSFLTVNCIWGHK